MNAFNSYRMKMKESGKRISYYHEGFNVEQVNNIHDVLNEFKERISVEVPTNIIEIGTFNGGFSIILSEIFNTEIHTFDIVQKARTKNLLSKRLELFEKKRINFYLGNCFEDQKEKIISLIQKEGLTLLFCDGGNKKKEINEFAKYLKEGDIIFGHDYSYDKATFEYHMQRKRWNCCELVYKHVQEELEKNNCQLYMRDLFDNAAWLCARKSK